jgi:hypothetical protein
MTTSTAEKTDTTQDNCPMMAEPTKEHKWLLRLIGEWSFEGECMMGPDQPPMKSSGHGSIRSLGGLWIVNEGTGEMPGGGEAQSIMTLGYDPAKGKFVGTFIASMMTHLWLYEGVLDASGKVLTLDAEGPSMTGDGGLAKYQDIVTVENDDLWMLSSQMLGPDGQWHKFMTAHYRRKI